MTRTRKAAIGAIAITLAAAPIASAFAGGYGPHYGNPLYPVAGLAAAVVGTAAAIVTLPFAILGAAAAQAPAYYAPPPAQRSYYPPQGNVAPGYGQPYNQPYAYYPAPAANAYVPPAAQYRAGPPPNSYAQRAPYDAPRYPQYGDYEEYRAPANNGYYRQDGAAGGGSGVGSGGYYAPARRPYGAP